MDPQHSTEPSVLTPQVCWFPALTEANSPDGDVAWPTTFHPQHSTEPSVLTPQVWPIPALTEANSPDGGVAWPSRFKPQHSTEPSVLTPQVCLPPALTEANSLAESVPFEGLGSGSSEHPVSRMARAVAVTSRPMIDFDIAFTSLTSLSGTLPTPLCLTFHRMGRGPGHGAHGNTGCCDGCLCSVEHWDSSSTGIGHRSYRSTSYDCLDFSAPMTGLAAREAALINVNGSEPPRRT